MPQITESKCCEACLITCETEAADKGCTFCGNVSDPNYDVDYPNTGLVRHCLDCAIEFGVTQIMFKKLSTEDIHTPEVEPRHAV